MNKDIYSKVRLRLGLGLEHTTSAPFLTVQADSRVNAWLVSYVHKFSSFIQCFVPP